LIQTRIDKTSLWSRDCIKPLKSISESGLNPKNAFDVGSLHQIRRSIFPRAEIPKEWLSAIWSGLMRGYPTGGLGARFRQKRRRGRYLSGTQELRKGEEA
jgi:hypothetical protein